MEKQHLLPLRPFTISQHVVRSLPDKFPFCSFTTPDFRAIRSNVKGPYTIIVPIRSAADIDRRTRFDHCLITPSAIAITEAQYVHHFSTFGK